MYHMFKTLHDLENRPWFERFPGPNRKPGDVQGPGHRRLQIPAAAAGLGPQQGEPERTSRCVRGSACFICGSQARHSRKHS